MATYWLEVFRVQINDGRGNREWTRWMTEEEKEELLGRLPGYDDVESCYLDLDPDENDYGLDREQVTEDVIDAANRMTGGSD